MINPLGRLCHIDAFLALYLNFQFSCLHFQGIEMLHDLGLSVSYSSLQNKRKKLILEQETKIKDMVTSSKEARVAGQNSPGGSVGCAVRLETRRSRVQPLPRSATFFRGD